MDIMTKEINNFKEYLNNNINVIPPKIHNELWELLMDISINCSKCKALNIDSVSFSKAELICDEEGCGHPLRVQRICTNKDCICYEY